MPAVRTLHFQYNLPVMSDHPIVHPRKLLTSKYREKGEMLRQCRKFLNEILGRVRQMVGLLLKDFMYLH